jgi:hypothetical protein
MVVQKSLPALGLATAILRCLISFFLGLLSPVYADQNVTLAWNAVTDVAGYRLHYGTASGNYAQSQDVGNTTTATVSSLTPGVTYFFVVTALNTAGLESLPTNEVSFTPALNLPAISAMQQLPNGFRSELFSVACLFSFDAQKLRGRNFNFLPRYRYRAASMRLRRQNPADLLSERLSDWKTL